MRKLLEFANGDLAKRKIRVNHSSTSNKYAWTYKQGTNSIGNIVLGPGLTIIDYAVEGIPMPASTQGSITAYPLTVKYRNPVKPQAFYAVDVHVSFPAGTSSALFFAHSQRTSSMSANFPTDYTMTVGQTSEKHFVFVVDGIGPTSEGGYGSMRIHIGADKPWIFHRLEISKLN